MSWYSKIYTAVRGYRANNPLLGAIATWLLNVLLFGQVTGLCLSYYTYVTVTIGYYVTNAVQATIYLIISTILLCMVVWCLLKTILTSVARVPSQWRPSQELIDELKQVTPFNNDKYEVEKSTPLQIQQQTKILEKMCEQCNVKVAECDQVGRIKFCYECGHIKPDRCRHCGSCGKCCVKFDHHCPWINKCVTHSNYKYFLLYVTYSTIFVYFYLFTSLEGLIRYFIIQKWLADLPKLLAYLFTFTFGIIFGYYPLGELIIFHYQLIRLNETTVEQTKPAVLRYDNMADYNQGPSANFRQVFGWGLWLLPIHTWETDGLHHEIKYVNKPRIQYKVTDEPQTSSFEQGSSNGEQVAVKQI